MHRRISSLVKPLLVLNLGLVFAGCGSSEQSTTPRETAAAILYITPAATLDIDATVTAYALGLVP
ncbi:MAG: hypothetical protein RLZZ297_845, partial [Chloroflexota bacterium]